MTTFIFQAREIVSKSLSKLLEESCLYQSVKIDFSGIEKDINLIRPTTKMGISIDSKKIYLEELARFSDSDWTFETEDKSAGIIAAGVFIKNEESETTIKLPTLHLNCAKCKRVRTAHNSGYKNMPSGALNFSFQSVKDNRSVPIQIFALPYLCQSCKSEAVIFLVRREGLKLQLVGRSLFGKLDVPKCIPENEEEYYNEALLAFGAGRVLAAIFFLRVCIEQYMRRITQCMERINGDDLAVLYAKRLPDDFPARFTTLKTVYNELSASIHSANANSDVYRKALTDINSHFEQLKLLPLKKPEEIEPSK